MTRRQSARSRCSINYAKIGDGDNGSDDDFAESTPPNKKAKVDKKKKASVKAKRLPEKAEEKFEKQIKKALELSLSASQEEKRVVEKVSSDTLFDGNKIKSSLSNESTLSDTKQRDALCQEKDEIEVISKADSKKSKPIQKDDDYLLSGSSESEYDDKEVFTSESDGNEESDNSFTKPKAKFKKKTLEKLKKSTKPVQKKTPVKQETKKPNIGVLKEQTNVKQKLPGIARPVVKAAKVYHSSPISPLPQKKWNPPALAGSSGSRDVSSVKSPSTLRIGLSRNVRLKPLHPAASAKT